MSEIREYSSERDGIVWSATPPDETKSDYGKYFFEDSETGVLCKENLYPRGMMTEWHHHTHAHGMYVLEGTLHTDRGDYKPGTFLWWRAGCVAEHGASAEDDVRVFFMTAGKFDLLYDQVQGEVIHKEDDFIAIDTHQMEWEIKQSQAGTFYEKTLLDDDKTNMHVSLRKYPAGYEEDWHVNACSTGFYMLHGVSKTQGGFYGPGSFVWEHAGVVTRFGASKYTDAVLVYVADGTEHPQKALNPDKWDLA